MEKEQGIKIKWEPNTEGGEISFTLEDLEVNSIEEWDKLSEEDQQDKMFVALDGHGEQPYMFPVSWEQIF